MPRTYRWKHLHSPADWQENRAPANGEPDSQIDDDGKNVSLFDTEEVRIASLKKKQTAGGRWMAR